MAKERTAPAGWRRIVSAPAFLFVIFVLAVFTDPLFLRRNFAGRDLLPYHLSTEREIHDAWSSASLPLWTAHASGGRPLLPNPNVGALYPVRPLLAPLSFPLAMRIYPVLHWLVAGLGMIALLRAIGASAAGAWIAAATYVFSGVGVSEVFYTNIHPGMALLPWIGWAAARPASSARARIVPLALLFALDFLAGDPFTIGIAGAACVAWIVLETPPGARRRDAARLAGAILLAVLATAPQIVASALWAPLTNRAIVGLPLNVAAGFSVAPWRLLELVVPYPFGATWSLDPHDFWARAGMRTFFSSLFCGGLAVLAVPFLLSRTGRGSRFVLALALGAAAVCVLPWFLPASWGEWRSPVPLRYPEKFAVALVFALGVGAGLAADAFRAGARLPRWRLPVAIALAAVAAAASLAPGPVGEAATAALSVPSRFAGDAGRQIAWAFAEAGLFWVATLVGLELLRLGDRRASIVGLLMLTCVPVVANRRIVRTFPQDAVLAPPAFARWTIREDPAGAFRVLDESRYRAPSALDAAAQARDPVGNEFYRRSWFLYTPSLWGRGTVLNADPDVGDLSRAESLRRLSALFPAAENGAALFASLSLRHAIRYRDQGAIPGFRPAGGDALQTWDENPDALPAIRMAATWREAASAVDALAAMRSAGMGEIVVETGRSGRGASAGGSVSSIEDRGRHLRFSVDAVQAGWVFVLRGFWPYRTVQVDGRLVEIAPAQLAFSALPVPAGRHRVDWREDLPGGEISWIGPVLALAGVWIVARRDRVLPRQAAGPPA
ncbi:MAG: hypothetical protein M3167_15535 [Acidobacteriota bacterium]|nr:hypothetical protein [Acidobacteriota bacterium]